MNPCGVKATKIWGHLLLNIIQPLLTHTIGLEAKLHSGPELILVHKNPGKSTGVGCHFLL